MRRLIGWFRVGAEAVATPDCREAFDLPSEPNKVKTRVKYKARRIRAQNLLKNKQLRRFTATQTSMVALVGFLMLPKPP